MTSINEDDPTLDIIKTLETKIPIEEIIPDHLRQELLVMRAVEDRSSWRTGDIANEIWENAKKKNIPITKREICACVAYFRGISSGRVMNVSHVCARFPPEQRKFACPFSHYEMVFHALPSDRVEETMMLSEGIKKETGEMPSYKEVIKIALGKIPQGVKLVQEKITKAIAGVIELKQDFPDKTKELNQAIEILLEVESSLNSR